MDILKRYAIQYKGLSIGNHHFEFEVDDRCLLCPSETPSFGNVIEALDRSGEVLNNAYTVFSLLNSAESNDRMQADDMEISPLVSAHNDNIYLNDRLFQKVKAVYDQREYLSLDPQQLRLLSLIHI